MILNFTVIDKKDQLEYHLEYHYQL